MKKETQIETEQINAGGLSLVRLTAVAIGATIASGVFTLSGDMAASGAGTGAVLLGWGVCGVGMLSLALCFYGLSRRKPQLSGGIYSYARAGFGEYVGFNSAWGYWISALLSNVSFITLLFAALGNFIPAFGAGNNLLATLGGSLVLWLAVFLVLKGVQEAAAVNLIVTIAKLIPIFTLIVAVLFARAFDPEIFVRNFWVGADGMSLGDQIKATTYTTVWAFTGIEGAVAISGRAKKSADVGRATVTSFLGVLALYVVISVLSMGILPRETLAELKNPPLAGIMEYVVGPWGAMLVNVGVVISLLGATLGYTIIASESAYEAAKQGSFAKSFAKVNQNDAPVFSILVSNVIIQGFLIILYFNRSTYQVFYTISASMIMVPYFLSALYYLKVVARGEGFSGASGAEKTLAWVIAGVGTLYGLWMLYAGGFTGLLITALLYAPGTFIYIKGKKEKGEAYFTQKKDLILLAILLMMFVLSLWLLWTGTIKPF